MCGEALDGRSDIFSFGVVLYELLSGLQPFAEKSTAATAAAILTSTPPALARFNKDVPAELERILGKTLRKTQDERYQTIKDLLIDLRNFKDELDFQHRLERSSTSKPVELGSTLLTEPEHAKMSERVLVGTTPINNLRIARGQYILYVEKDGYAKTESTISGAILHVGNLVVIPSPIAINQRLFQLNQMPDQMTFVPGGDYRLAAWARPTDMKVRLDDFFIDRYEVRNRDYREFINAGCYLKREYWKYPIVRDGKALSWESD